MVTRVTRPLCLVLLSGGLDSAVTAAWCVAQGYEVTAMSFDYGQRHRIELDCAADLVQALGLREHIVASLPLGTFGGSTLTDPGRLVHKENPENPVDSSMIPDTYVPMRNLLFLTVASAWLEARGGHLLAMGVNAVDYSGYPDCRPEFIEAFASAANQASKRVAEGEPPLKILTPLIDLAKEEIIQMGLDLAVPFELASSCYDPDNDGRPCGGCDSCRIRQQAFERQGMRDPRETYFAARGGST